MMVAGALVVSLLAGLPVLGLAEQLVDRVWNLNAQDHDGEVCLAPTINCSGGWQALATSVSEDIKTKSKIKRQNSVLQTTQKELEEMGIDTFEIPIPPSMPLDKDFFKVLEEAIPEMKKYSRNKQYDEHVIKFMKFILKRIHKDITLLNKTLHIELIGPDGLPTGLRPVVEYLDEHMKQREEDMQIFF